MQLGNAPVLGKSDAPVTMVEFTDLECPFCRAFHTASFEEIKRKYIDTGKLRYVSRDYPLPFHPQALPAARVARCAGEQGRFWEMREALITNALDTETMVNLARGMKLDQPKLQACIGDERIEKAVQADIADAESTAGVSGTPTFVIGKSGGDSVEGLRIVGAQPLPIFEGRIQSLLEAR
jgi:protein-disulfide isomerase